MKFDNKKDAILRYIKVDDCVVDDGRAVSRLRIRFTDGSLFAWSIPVEEGVKPFDLANLFMTLAEGITEVYGGDA